MKSDASSMPSRNAPTDGDADDHTAHRVPRTDHIRCCEDETPFDMARSQTRRVPKRSSISFGGRRCRA